MSDDDAYYITCPRCNLKISPHHKRKLSNPLVICKKCGFKTDVYGQGDLNMWKREDLTFPDCPQCRNTLEEGSDF